MGSLPFDVFQGPALPRCFVGVRLRDRIGPAVIVMPPQSRPRTPIIRLFDHRMYSRCVIFRAPPGEQPPGLSRQSTPEPARLAAVCRLGNALYRSTSTLVRLAERGKYK